MLPFLSLIFGRILALRLYICVWVSGSEIKCSTNCNTTRSFNNVFAERTWIYCNRGTHKWGLPLGCLKKISFHDFQIYFQFIFLKDGSVQEFENNYSLLCPLICDAVAVKEDRRIRKPHSSSSSTAPLTQAAGYSETNGGLQHVDGAEPMEQSHEAPNGEGHSQSNGLSLQPSTINLL